MNFILNMLRIINIFNCKLIWYWEAKYNGRKSDSLLISLVLWYKWKSLVLLVGLSKPHTTENIRTRPHTTENIRTRPMKTDEVWTRECGLLKGKPYITEKRRTTKKNHSIILWLFLLLLFIVIIYYLFFIIISPYIYFVDSIFQKLHL